MELGVEVCFEKTPMKEMVLERCLLKVELGLGGEWVEVGGFGKYLPLTVEIRFVPLPAWQPWEELPGGVREEAAAACRARASR